MKERPVFHRARRVFDLLLPRFQQLGLCGWLCNQSAKVLSGDESTRREIEEALSARAIADAAREGIVPMPGGGWAIPLRLENLGSDAPLIIAIVPKEQSEKTAIELARTLDWFTRDLCKSVKDDETLEQLGVRLTHAYEEVNLLFRIAGSLNKVQEPVKLLETVCAEICTVLPIGWMALKFANEAGAVPQLRGQLIVAGKTPADAALLESDARLVLSKAVKGPYVKLLKPGVSQLAGISGSDVLGGLISHDRHRIGVLLAGNAPDGDFSSDEMQFLHAVTEFLGIFHGNLARFVEQQAMFMGTLRALVAAIDAKDPYTRGHSERVAVLTRKLAAAMGMSPQDVETYYVAALVHDVGKIGVPEAVLSKVGTLDDVEFEWIKRHPEIGHRILKGIPAMAPMLPGVLYHHERWDGLGYPNGLAGEEIPIMARVIAFADTFDAMSSMRSYRPALPREEILGEIRECAGAQFDPALMELFLGLDFSEFEAMLKVAATKAAA